MYISGNYGKVKSQMENRRLEAIAQAEERNNELRARSDEIRKIDEELTGTGLALFRTALCGGDIDALRERNQQLCRQRRQLLCAMGYPADYTDVHYACPKCSDTGYVGTAMCSCLRDALIRENLRTSGMGELIEKQSFHNFNLERYKRDGEDVYCRMCQNFRIAKEYAHNFAKKRTNLLLIGPTGTGKTHISTSIAKEVIEQGFDVFYDTAQNIIAAFEYDRFHSGYGQPVEAHAQKYLQCTLLIVDDLGTEFSNAFTISCLYNLFNERQNKGLATVISTNLSAAELTKNYEDRIYSRIIGRDSIILSFAGGDYRL